MKKFLFILFICALIFEIICTDKDEAGPSQRENKGKTQMEEEHSDSDNLSNSSNSNDFPQELISNPAIHENLENIISPADMNWLKELETTNVENVPHSPNAKQQMAHDTDEEDHSEKVHEIKKSRKKPRKFMRDRKPDMQIGTTPNNFRQLVQQFTGLPNDPEQLMLPFHHPIQHSPGSSLARPTLPAGISDEQFRKAQSDLLHNYHQKLQQHSTGQPIHQIIETSHEIHQKGQQQIVRPIPIRFHRDNNQSTNPGQTSSHRTLPPIPQSIIVHSGTNLLQQEKEQQEEQHKQFWQNHPQLAALKGSLLTAEQKLIELRIEDDQMVNQTLQYEMRPTDEFIKRRIHLSNQISQFEDMKRQILQQILECSTI